MNLLVLSLLTFIFTKPARAPAAAISPEQSVEAGRDALKSWNGFPWYDQDKDDVRPVEINPPRERSSRSDLNFDWLQWLSWLLIALLLVALAALLIRAYLAREAGAGVVVKTSRPGLVQADKVEALPFMAQRSRQDLLGEARRQYEQGNYSEAIIYLFSYELVQLDRRQFIRLAKGKTNRQYLREVAALSRVGPLLERTMVAFEDVFFGRHYLDRARFESCWNALDEFERLLSQGNA